MLAALLTAIYRRAFSRWIAEAVFPLPRFLANAIRHSVAVLHADSRLHFWMLLTLCLLGAMLRVWFLFDPVSFDEADTLLSYASRPLYVGLSWYPQPNNHLFHTLLLHFAWRLFGDAEWAIRLPALCAGIVLIPVTYWAARVLYEQHAALIAAALVAAAPSLVSFSVNGRGYTLVCVFFLLLLIIGRYLLEHESPPAWLLWALVAALGFYTIPIMLYAASTAMLWLGLSACRSDALRSRRQLLTRLGSALVVTGIGTTVLYLPVVIASGVTPLFANGYVQSRTFSYVFANFPESFEKTWYLLTADVPGPFVFVLTAAFAIALVYHRDTNGYGVPVPLAAAVCIPVLVLIQRVVPFARVWLFLVPLCSIVSAAGLWLPGQLLASRSVSRGSHLAVAIALSCFLLMGVAGLYGESISSRSALPGIEDIAIWMKGNLAPRDVVVVGFPATAPLAYYLRRHGIPLESRPAPCDPMSTVYSANAWFRAWPVSGETRVLAVVTDQWHSPKTVLATACLAANTEFASKRIYTRPGMHVYERYVGPGVH